MLKCDRQNWATDKQVTVVSNIGHTPNFLPPLACAGCYQGILERKKSLEPDMVMLIGSLRATVNTKQLT